MSFKTSSKEDRIVLGYYPLRAKMQICRLLCEYLHLNYKDLLFTPATWENFKETQRLNWNYQELPFLLDNNLVVTETYPINLYIIYKGNRKDLLGLTFSDQAKVDMFVWDSELMCQMLSAMLNARTKEGQVKEFMKYWNHTIKPKLVKCEHDCEYDSYLKYLTVVDFYIYDLVYYMKACKIDVLINFEQEFPKLRRIYEKISQIEEIKSYENSPKAIKNICPAEFCEQWKEKCVKNNPKN